jgi:hypothetical protein
MPNKAIIARTLVSSILLDDVAIQDFAGARQGSIAVAIPSQRRQMTA